MIKFTDTIVGTLNEYFSTTSQFVEAISLTSWGFNIRFLDFDIQCNENVCGDIRSNKYVWSDAPTDAPWGLFGRQCASKAYLVDPLLLCIEFESGDSISIRTSKCAYESVIFTFPPKEGSVVMEVF